MKVFVLLALVAFSGCNADADVAKTNLDVVKDAFWDYVAKATFTAEDSLEQIKQSAFGQEVNTRISESAEAVNQYFVALQAQFEPLTKDLFTKLTQEAEKLKTRIDTDLASVGTALEPYAEEIKSELEKQMEDLKKDVLAWAKTMDSWTLGTAVQQRSLAMKEKLDQSIQTMQIQMGPLAGDLKQKMDQSMVDFQKNMEPLTQSFQTQLAQRSEQIQQSLSPHELRTQLNVNAEDLEAQLAKLWKSFTENIQ